MKSGKTFTISYQTKLINQSFKEKEKREKKTLKAKREEIMTRFKKVTFCNDPAVHD